MIMSEGKQIRQLIRKKIYVMIECLMRMMCEKNWSIQLVFIVFILTLINLSPSLSILFYSTLRINKTFFNNKQKNGNNLSKCFQYRHKTYTHTYIFSFFYPFCSASYFHMKFSYSFMYVKRENKIMYC